MKLAGHKSEKNLLLKLLHSKTIPHAMLFSGPDKVGKKTVALEFIKSLNCINIDWCCNECYACRSINADSYPDFIMIKPLEGSREIKIDQLRDLNERFSLTSFGGGYKAVIVDDAHLMNQHAQNSFLKLLEEPKGKTVIILISHRPEMLLPTIRSRVQELKFSILPKKDIEEYLKEMYIDNAFAQEIATISSGQIGKAIDYARDKEKKDWFDRVLKDILMLTRENMGKRFAYSKEHSENYEEMLEMFEIWERFFRKEMLIKMIKPENSNLANYSFDKIKRIVKKISQSKNLIENTNSSKKLVFDGLMMEL